MVLVGRLLHVQVLLPVFLDNELSKVQLGDGFLHP